MISEISLVYSKKKISCIAQNSIKDSSLLDSKIATLNAQNKRLRKRFFSYKNKILHNRYIIPNKNTRVFYNMTGDGSFKNIFILVFWLNKVAK